LDFHIPQTFLAADDWASAKEALKKISEHKTAAGKLGCIVQTAQEIISALNIKARDDPTIVLTGDETLTIFIYVVLFR
jgi:hypothetical protein